MHSRIGKNPLGYLFSKTWRYSEGNRKNIVRYWLLFIAAVSITVFCHPLIWAHLMNSLQAHGISAENLTTLFWCLFLIVAFDIIFWCAHGPGRLMEEGNAFIARANYRKYLLKGVMMLPLDWHTDHHSGDTIDKVEKGAGALFQFSGNTFQLIYGAVRLIGSYAMLAYVSPSAAVIVFAMMCLSAYITVRFDAVIVGHYRELNRAENRVSESVFDAISNVTTVIILRVERLVFESIVRKIEKPYALFVRNNRYNEAKWFLTSMCCSAMTVLVLGAYFWKHRDAGTGILLGHVYLLISYLGKISDTFFDFTSMYGDVVQRRAKVLNAEEITTDFKDEEFGNHVLPPQWDVLSIRDLNFTYQAAGEDRIHLDDVSFDLCRGERIAFIGESGSGKTTLLKLMRNLHKPAALSLCVDGTLIPQGFEGIARAIALVPQAPEIFATTIRENITLGAEHDPMLIARYIDMACFADVVAELPRGLETSIKEKGVNLSGGQQQRLALTRGLLACHDKDIILLDEPTSNLDASNQARVYQNILDGMQGKTIISSFHGLHLLPLFDRIFVFERGKLAAVGDSQEQLLQESEVFRNLWRHFRQQQRS